MFEYDWLSLDSEEVILWSGEPRVKSIIPVLIIGLPLSIVLIGIPLIIGAYLNIKNTDFVVSSQGLYRKTGILSRNVQKIGFDKIQNISFNQSVFGNYFGYGNVDISTAGGSGIEMRFNSIQDPKEVQQLINKKIKGEEAVKKEASGNQMLEELRAIRKTLESIDNKL